MAWTALLAAGAKLRGAALSAFITEVRPIHVRLGSDFPLTASSTTLQSVTGLVIPLAANTTYIIDADLVARVAAGTTEDIKYGALWPTGSSVDIFALGPAATMAAGTVAADMQVIANLSATSGVSAIPFGCTSSNSATRLRIWIAVGGTAGNFTIQAAQNTSGANVVTVCIGSLLTGRQVE